MENMIMLKHLLTPSQQQLVNGVLTDAGVNATELALRPVAESESGRLTQRLQHKSGDFFFDIIMEAGGGLHCRYSPSSESVLRYERPGNWQYLQRYFADWAKSLALEQNLSRTWNVVFDDLSESVEFRNVGYEVLSKKELSSAVQLVDAIERRILEALPTREGDAIESMRDDVAKLRESTSKTTKRLFAFAVLGFLVHHLASQGLTELYAPLFEMIKHWLGGKLLGG